MNIPGFTAEHSLHKAKGATYRGVAKNSSVFKAEIRPQLDCHWDGVDLICGEPPFGGGVGVGGPVDHITAQCRARCRNRYKHNPAALADCLADC